MSNTVKTAKGTVLPLTNLKGKDYLMIAYRIQWMNEDITNFDISTDFLKLEEDYTVARAKVTLFDEAGKPLKSATATKRETKADFSDHTEKAETSAVGRALAMLGFGTQFAISDLDEGNRLADSPLKNTKSFGTKKATAATSTPSASSKTTSFRKPSNGSTQKSEWK